MPSDTALNFRRRVLLENQWRRRSRMGVLLSLAGHLLLVWALRDVPIRSRPEAMMNLGYEGPTRLVNLAPEEEIIRSQEELAAERVKDGALRAQTFVPHDPALAERASDAASEMVFPPIRVIRPRPQPAEPEEPIIIVLGEDWSQQPTSGERALSEQFQTLKIVRPAYPTRAIREEIEGLVELEVRVDILGRVAGVTVLRSPPFGLDIEEAAIRAMRQWEFKPLRKERRLVPFTVIVPFRFRLLG